jgi:hypothetical protein
MSKRAANKRTARLAERVERAVIAQFEVPAGLPRKGDTLPSNSDVAKAINRELDTLNVAKRDRGAVLREIEARCGRAS